MIIKTMEQLGKCIDDGIELEYRSEPDDWRPWVFTSPLAHSIAGIKHLVDEYLVRTKPRTVDLVIRSFDNEANTYSGVWFGDVPYGPPPEGFTDHKVTVTLDGE